MPGHLSRIEFWSAFEVQLRAAIVRYRLSRIDINAIRSVSVDNDVWYSIGSHIENCFFAVAFKSVQGGFQKRSQVEFVIDKPRSETWNDVVFEKLRLVRWDIEAPFSRRLSWHNARIANGGKVNRRLIGVDHPMHLDHVQDEKDKQALITWMITNLIGLHYVVDKHIDGAIKAANVAI